LVIAAARIMLIKVFHQYDFYVLMLTLEVTGIVMPIIFYNISMRAGCWFLYTFKKPPAEIAV